MKRFRPNVFIFVVMGLSACSSQPPKDHYYSLVLEADEATAPITSENAISQLIVGPIQLARYLNQPGLAMQLGSNQIRNANHHFWAESLDEAIGKILVRDISERVDSVAVDRDAGRWTNAGDCQLRVEFDEFHATEDSRVVAKGRYWIHENEREQFTKKDFDIFRTLTESGYPHAVRQLRATLESLAEEIVELMNDTDTCIPMT